MAGASAGSTHRETVKPLFAAAVLWSAFAASTLIGQAGHPHSTVDAVRAAHQLACGVVQEDAEYSTEDDHSSRGAFDSALCQAYALAVDREAVVKVTSFLDEVSAEDALRAGTLDVIASVSADATHAAKDIRLSRAIFYDSLALLAPLADGAKGPRDLAGKKICVLAETGTEEALRAWFAGRRIDYLPFPFQEEGEMEAAYISNNCAAIAGERTRLSLIRLSLGESAAEHILLPEPLSRDPMSSATRADDAQWSRIVDLVAGTLLLAEQLGVTSANIDSPANREGASANALWTGVLHAGAALGLRPAWAADVRRHSGNYGELYERTLGKGSDRKLPRDLNRLQRDGGLLTPTTLR